MTVLRLEWKWQQEKENEREWEEWQKTAAQNKIQMDECFGILKLVQKVQRSARIYTRFMRHNEWYAIKIEINRKLIAQIVIIYRSGSL